MAGFRRNLKLVILDEMGSSNLSEGGVVHGGKTMNEKEVEAKIREIAYAYQLIADLKQELYGACPKEKRIELHNKLRKTQYDSDMKAYAKEIQRIIGTDAKKNEYAEPLLCYDKRFKEKNLKAENNGLEMRTFMQNDPNFIEAIIDLRGEKENIYSSTVKITRKAGSQELEVFLYGDFEETRAGENRRHFVKKIL